MAKYARLNPDDTIAEIRTDLRELPPDIPHKNVRWRELVEQQLDAYRAECYRLGDPSLAIGDKTVTRIRQPVRRDEAEIRDLYIRRVKAEAAQRIEAIMPDYKQRNMLALAVENIRAYGPDTAKWPDEIQAIAADADDRWARIKAIRMASNVIESDIMAADFAALEAFDLSKGWPV